MARTKLSIKFRPMIGKIFSLKNHKKIPYYVTRSSNCEGMIPRTSLGDAILVIEESDSRIRVLTKENTMVWIGKYYIQEELESELKKPKLNLVRELLEEVASLYTKMNSEELKSIMTKTKELEELLSEEKI